MSTVTISRDPAGRSETVRRTISEENQNDGYGCRWCGGSRRGGSLFQYGTERDGLTRYTDWHDGYFCSKGCHDSYHN